ncbi:hypothetical protein MKSMC1_37520 [Mycobacterium kansasii]|nr:hypothetical protein MKSMC1_37520 [Mycobacterium kansasii]
MSTRSTSCMRSPSATAWWVEGPHGAKAHPALTAAQQQRIVLARLAASLRLPSGDQDDPSVLRRPQRRGAARGVYGIAGA